MKQAIDNVKDQLDTERVAAQAIKLVNEQNQAKEDALRQKEIRDEVEMEATKIVKAAEIQIEKEAKQDEVNKESLSEGVIDLVSKNLAVRDKAKKEHQDSTA